MIDWIEIPVMVMSDRFCWILSMASFKFRRIVESGGNAVVRIPLAAAIVVSVVRLSTNFPLCPGTENSIRKITFASTVKSQSPQSSRLLWLIGNCPIVAVKKLRGEILSTKFSGVADAFRGIDKKNKTVYKIITFIFAPMIMAGFQLLRECAAKLMPCGHLWSPSGPAPNQIWLTLDPSMRAKNECDRCRIGRFSNVRFIRSTNELEGASCSVNPYNGTSRRGSPFMGDQKVTVMAP